MSQTSSIVKPTKDEVYKNRIFGMPTTKLSRNQRVSFTAMIKIAFDELSKDKDTITFEYPVDDFFEMIGIKQERKQSHLFTQTYLDDDSWIQEKDDYSLERTLKDLVNKSIDFRHKDDSGIYEVSSTALISHFSLTKEKVTFRFDEWVRNRIPIETNGYIMKLPIIAAFKSGYSVVLFEQLEQRRDFRRWATSKNMLRTIFGIEDNKYKIFSSFRRDVLEKSINEINEKTNYSLAIEYIKKGRSVDKIIFTWYINKTSLEEFKSFIRKHFINTPLVDTLVAGDKSSKHLISVKEDGKLYNQRSTHLYTTEDAKRIWKWLYEHQEQLLIKEQVDNLENYKEDNFAKYYGKNLIFDDEMFDNIVFIQPTSKKNKIKIKFYSGELLIMSEEDFMSSVII